MYKVVQSANIMIEEVANVKELSAVEVERYRAECKFLRNLAYFFMVRIFGDVTYYTECLCSCSTATNGQDSSFENLFGRFTRLYWIMTPIRVFCRGGMEVAACAPTGGAVLTLMMHMNMWLAFSTKNNAVTYYNEVRRLAETDSWIDSSIYSLQSMSQMSEVFQGESNEGLFEIAQNVTMGEIFKTDHMWCTKVVYKIRNRTEPEFKYSKSF